MCNLNKLKNKIYTKKLINFLNLYSHIVFYHSNKGNALRQCQQIVENGEKVLFLVNGARLKKLFPEKSTSAPAPEGAGERSPLSKELHSYLDSAGRGSSQVHPPQALEITNTSGEKSANPLQRPDSPRLKRKAMAQSKKNLISQLCASGITGNSFLVGCASLAAMQKCIRECKLHNASSYVCLGGISKDQYLDHLDCLRLTQIDLSRTTANLIHTITAIQKSLLSTLHKPGGNLLRILESHKKECNRGQQAH